MEEKERIQNLHRLLEIEMEIIRNKFELLERLASSVVLGDWTQEQERILALLERKQKEY